MGCCFTQKGQKNPPLIRAKLRNLHLLEREASPEEAEEGVVGVVVAVALLAVALLVPVVTATPHRNHSHTHGGAPVHHLPQTATLQLSSDTWGESATVAGADSYNGWGQHLRDPSRDMGQQH